MTESLAPSCAALLNQMIANAEALKRIMPLAHDAAISDEDLDRLERTLSEIGDAVTADAVMLNERIMRIAQQAYSGADRRVGLPERRSGIDRRWRP